MDSNILYTSVKTYETYEMWIHSIYKSYVNRKLRSWQIRSSNLFHFKFRIWKKAKNKIVPIGVAKLGAMFISIKTINSSRPIYRYYIFPSQEFPIHSGAEWIGNPSIAKMPVLKHKKSKKYNK